MKRPALFIFLCLPSLLMAQHSNITTLFVSNFEKAELLHKQFAYRNALQYYLIVAEKDAGNEVAKQRIADCYFKLGNIPEAEKRYAELTLVPDADAKLKYEYAQILDLQGKYTDAQKWYESASKGETSDPRAEFKLAFFRQAHYYKRDSVLYEIKKEPYNSDQSDFAPQFHYEGVVFVSARDRDQFVKRQSLSARSEKEAMLNVFLARPDATAEKDAIPFFRDLNTPYHDGPVSFYENGKRIVFTRNNMLGRKAVDYGGKVNLKLYFAEVNKKNDITGTEPFTFNSNAYSIGHPWISHDGTILYFSSDMPGGKGGADIYRSEKKEGKWETPLNAGPEINTPGDEFYPFMANDTTLFFSSNGHGGLGGLDIYLSYRKGSSFTAAKNVGFPLNTFNDDFSLILDISGRKGMFSSNRNADQGNDDLYSFTVKSFFVVGKVVQHENKSQPIDKAKVVVKEKSGRIISSVYSDPNGHFSFDVPFDKDYLISASRDGYSMIDTLRFHTHARLLGYDSITINLTRHSLVVKGSVYSNESQGKLSKTIVSLMNLTDGTVDSLATDSTGSYTFTGKSNKRYTIRAKKRGFLAKEINLNTQDLYHKDLINDFLLEEAFIDKVLVQFDFGKADIRKVEIEKLEKLYRDLNSRPGSTLLVSAFADSKGTQQYNQVLSDKRVNAVIAFFTSRGIAMDRMTGKGFGESLLLHGCSDGVDCNEQEHSLNRRAEIKMKAGN